MYLDYPECYNQSSNPEKIIGSQVDLVVCCSGGLRVVYMCVCLSSTLLFILISVCVPPSGDSRSPRGPRYNGPSRKTRRTGTTGESWRYSGSASSPPPQSGFTPETRNTVCLCVSHHLSDGRQEVVSVRFSRASVGRINSFLCEYLRARLTLTLSESQPTSWKPIRTNWRGNFPFSVRSR